MSLAARFRTAAARTPQAVAVVQGSDQTTYGELDQLANQLARALASRGVGEGDRVGIWADKSAAALAAMQAALRIGAIYVPLDPQSPVPRIRAIIASAGIRVLVTTESHATRLRSSELVQLGWVDLGADRQEPPVPLPPVDARADRIAYILFTSGSTGTPKGVCITDGNACAFIDWATQTIDATSHDRFANHAPLHFDLSVLDLYVAWNAGATVCLVSEGTAYAPRRLVQFLVDQRISVWYSVPSALLLMMQRGGLLETETPHLRCILFAGEPFPVRPLRDLIASRPQARFFNLYGPTETNVCTAYEVPSTLPPDLASLPIGRACCGNQVWIRKPDGAPVGELMVEGPTVMHGYWGQPAHRGPYPTGDLVRQQESGDFEYVGRQDHLVKVRGHRVELGEVEAALMRHDAIERACVLVSGKGTAARLIAWCESAAPPGLLELKRHCAGLLPSAMIISEAHFLDELPRTRNGKVDRQQLEKVTRA